jgi:type II secretory pathway pseudopilin PulG
MRRINHDDGGFTLVEAAVALLIASFIFAGLAQTIASALRATEQRRLEQQAVTLIGEALEDVRRLTFDEVALLPSVLDPSRTPDTSYDPGTGPEPIIQSADSAIPAQVTAETIGPITYTLTRYVTWVDDSPFDPVTTDYKRVTVIATWETRGQTRTEVGETLAASREARDAATVGYGVKIDPTVGSANTPAGTTVSFVHTVENTGTGSDTLELALVNDLGWPVWMVRMDTGFPPITTNGIPTPDTGPMNPGDTLDLEVFVRVPVGTPANFAADTTVVVSSAAKPAVAASAVNRVKSTGGTGSPIPVTLHLRRSGVLSPAAPAAGHAELSGANGTTWTWTWTVPADIVFTTDATVNLFVRRRGTCVADDVEYRATLTGSVTGTLDSRSSGNVTAECVFTPAYTVLSVNGGGLVAGETLQLDVEVLKVSGGNADKRGLNLAYDGIDLDSFVFFEVATP